MIKITKPHVLALLVQLRAQLPTNVFGINCRFAKMPPKSSTPGRTALEVVTCGFYDGSHVIRDVVSWIEPQEITTEAEFAEAIDEHVHAHLAAHMREADLAAGRTDGPERFRKRLARGPG